MIRKTSSRRLFGFTLFALILFNSTSAHSELSQIKGKKIVLFKEFVQDKESETSGGFYHPAMPYKRPTNVAADRNKEARKMLENIESLPEIPEEKKHQVSLLFGQSSTRGTRNTGRSSFGLGFSNLLERQIQLSFELLFQSHDQIQDGIPNVEVKRYSINPEIRYVFVPYTWINQPYIGAGLAYTAMKLDFRESDQVSDGLDEESIFLDELSGTITVGMDFKLIEGVLLGFQWKGLLPVVNKNYDPGPGYIAYESDLSYMFAGAAKVQF